MFDPKFSKKLSQAKTLIVLSEADFQGEKYKETVIDLSLVLEKINAALLIASQRRREEIQEKIRFTDDDPEAA